LNLKVNLAQSSQYISQYIAPVRIVALLLILVGAWLPLAIPLYLWVSDVNLRTILTMAVLFILFLGLLWHWGRWAYRKRRVFWWYGLVLSRRFGRELLLGLAIGFAAVVGLFITEGLLGWVALRSPSLSLLRVIPEGLLAALGIAFAEELFFRGWLLEELERDYPEQVAAIANSAIFALLHFLKPLSEVARTFPQFPALMLLGLATVWAKRSTRRKLRNDRILKIYGGRLSLPIGLHAGLVWGYYVINIGQLTTPLNRVPAWVTGVDGNPLMGVMGVMGLGAIALYMHQRCRK
jgi:uncharacterized protein